MENVIFGFLIHLHNHIITTFYTILQLLILLLLTFLTISDKISKVQRMFINPPLENCNLALLSEGGRGK